MSARIAMAATKGCDGVEPDNTQVAMNKLTVVESKVDLDLGRVLRCNTLCCVLSFVLWSIYSASMI